MSITDKLPMLQIWQKLTLVCAAFILPIAVLLYFMVVEQQKPIDFAQKELYGTAYLRPSRTLMEHLWDHRLLVKRARDGEVVSPKEQSDVTRGIETDLSALDSLDRVYGETLSQEDRKTKDYLSGLRKKWQEMQAAGGKGAQSDALHLAAIKDVRGLIALVGDTSNLILDPDLDSYYVMDSVLLKLPEAHDQLGQMIDFGEEQLAAGNLTNEQKTEFVVRLAGIRSLHDALNSPLSGLPTAYKAVNDSSPDKSLESKLSAPLRSSVTASADFANNIEDKIVKPAEATMKPREFTADGVRALNASFLLWDEAVKGLDDILVRRIARFRRDQFVTLGFSITALLFALVLVLYVIRGVTRQLHAMRELFSQLGMGNFQARAAIVTHDDLGQMAGMLNDSILPLVQSFDEKAGVQASIETLMAEVGVVASGDLTVQAQVSQDITGPVAGSFNAMIGKLREVVSNVQDATLQVSSSANEIQITTEHLSRGSEAQASQMVDTSAALDEMAVSIQQVSENTLQSATVADQARANARNGNEAVQNTIQGMERIRTQVQETAKRIKRLGESSQEVGEIVQLIGDIADRTSILALNASIQAAMAGEAGKGFAVVAEEVERLAERSNAATREIAGLIKTIQSETAEAVAAMEESTREVVDGSKVAMQAGMALTEIDTVSNRLAELIQSISLATKQQARGAEALSKSMSEISEVTQHTAAGTRQAAVSVSNLARLADDLRSSVSTFKLPGGGHGANGHNQGNGNGNSMEHDPLDIEMTGGRQRFAAAKPR